jgi:S-adenosylmethionine synthetase
MATDADNRANGLLIIEATSCPDKKNVFVVGPFGKRIGFASQQYRALNLIWALEKYGPLKPNARVAVVGAGIAGLAACAGLLARRYEFELFERKPEELTRQRHTNHRFIHPTINAWPESALNPTTSLPFFDWSADICADVIREIEQEWRFHFRDKGSKPHLNREVVGIENDADGDVTLIWRQSRKKNKPGAVLGASLPTRKAGPFGAVILCIGFGDEFEFEGSAALSYWRGDSIDEARVDQHERYFVSGTGDGGLIETLRLIHRDFDRGKMAIDLARNLDGSPVARRIKEAEEALQRHPASLSPDSLTDTYLSCAGDIPAQYQQRLQASLCNKGNVYLIATSKDPFRTGAAPIHKLLVAHAVRNKVVKLREGRLERHAGKCFLVKDKKREVINPDFLVVRHGAGANLTNIISEVALNFLKQKQNSLNDHIARSLWEDDFFDGVHEYQDRDIGDISFAVRLLPRATRAIASIEGLETLEIIGTQGALKYVARTKPNFTGGNIPGLPKDLFGIPLVIRSARRMEMLASHRGSKRTGPFGVSGPPWFVIANAIISANHSMSKTGKIGGLFQKDTEVFAVTAAHVLDESEVDIWMREHLASRTKRIGNTKDAIGLTSLDGAQNNVSEKLVWFKVADEALVDAAAGSRTRTILAQSAFGQLGQRVVLGSRPLTGRVTAVEASAYLTDGVREGLFHGGLVVEPQDPKQPFAIPGDSGSPVFNEVGETIGVVVAGDDEGTFIAPLARAAEYLNMRPLTEGVALRRNEQLLARQSKKLGRSVIPVGKRFLGRRSHLFTSEAVSEGHPDKVCDRISDELVDLFFREGAKAGLDPWAIRAACETLATTNKVVIAGEVRGPQSVNDQLIEKTVRSAIKDIGYEQDGFHWRKVDIEILLHSQSADIARGVDASQFGSNREEGAGDQGIMFGYACNETPALMPAPLFYAHRILKSLSVARKNRRGAAAVLGPDAKSQLTIYYENGKPLGAAEIVLSTQHLDPDLSSSEVMNIVEPYIRRALPTGWITSETVWHINPTGRFVIGGPDGDCGLTGRKIIVDTYGGAAPHGGGAFSGKDPSKVDRSAAYAARYLAKNIVAAGLADRCTLQLAYAIGVARPLSLYIDTHGTGKVSEEKLEQAVAEVMNLTPRGIREHLDLNKPIYARTSSYGHFGRKPEKDGGFSWEKVDLVDALKHSIS